MSDCSLTTSAPEPTCGTALSTPPVAAPTSGATPSTHHPADAPTGDATPSTTRR